MTPLLFFSNVNHPAGDAFTLKSSKGPCAFERDALACGPHVNKPSEFTVRTSQKLLQDIVSSSYTAYRPRTVNSHTVITLLSMPKILPRGVHRVMCMLHKRGGLLRLRLPGSRSRWIIFTIVSLAIVVKHRSAYQCDVAQKSLHRMERRDCQVRFFGAELLEISNRKRGVWSSMLNICHFLRERKFAL